MPFKEHLKKHPCLRRELLIGGGALLTGAVLMPVLIYIAGTLTLGPYGPNAGFGTFLKDFYSGLLQGSAPIRVPAWIVVVGPYVLFALLRGVLLIHRRYLQGGGPADGRPDNG